MRGTILSNHAPFLLSLLLVVQEWTDLSLPLAEARAIFDGGTSTPMLGLSRHRSVVRSIRGGDEDLETTTTQTSSSSSRTVVNDNGRELSLDEKVHAAMLKLGLRPPASDEEDSSIASNGLPDDSSSTVMNNKATCDADSGVCTLPNTTSQTSNTTDSMAATATALQSVESTSTPAAPAITAEAAEPDPLTLAKRIANDMTVDVSLAWAALGATSEEVSDTTGNTATKTAPRRVYREQAARDMIQMELDLIQQINPDAEDVQLLVQEGHDSFLVRRALAFVERNVEDARAILLADQMDEEEEKVQAKALQDSVSAQEREQSEASFQTINVAAGFDPATLGGGATTAKEPKGSPTPAPASRESVVFEATAAQIQELVLESPVPVLLDIYADWCGPCKALSPILEEMAVKGGGAFRLVKVNSDNERPISQALEVTALPTIYGFRDGKILHMFQGMPKSEEMMRNFLMGLLIPGHGFIPKVTDNENQKYTEISAKLLKVAGSAAFSFSSRERLHDKVMARLEELVTQTGDVYIAEQSAATLRSLVSNILRDPYEPKFRTINLANSVVASKIAQFPACMAILKGIGFAADGSNMLRIGKSKKLFNVAPLSVTREAIDKWIDKTRYDVARAGRKRRDEADRVRIQAELATAKESQQADPAVAVESAVVDPNKCILKMRIDGKKKVYDLSLDANEPLSVVLDHLPGLSSTSGEFQVTCVAKRLVVKSTDVDAMKKSLRDHGLMPSAIVVVRPVSTTNSLEGGTNKGSKLSGRAATKKKAKKGTHTMQSIGIYAKDDNAKGELVDGGGGTLYEQDVSDESEQHAISIDETDLVSDPNPSEPDDSSEQEG